ncbi:Gfo/Idh/MocA family oxidoreductase [Specibacter cremeus]|uniref:Gfo/Idh/MocA family protein n=1 Tax=Specibacter cremeus TaxID=1629051 RepID=UPI000F7906BE|nr:Gfo/Idh/MocA family oxidoreductase [Specibacter cremeus]
MTPPIRTALLGFGLAGRVFHAPALAANARFDLAVIVTGDPGRRDEARAAHPGAEILSWDQWDAGVPGLELVVVATPPATHAARAHAALEAGADVVVDKPFTVTSAEGEALIGLAAARERVLSTYQNRRWDGEFLTLRRLLADGALGQVQRFESRLERRRQGAGKPWKAAATPADGGGVLYDLGSHLIDQALVLFGPVSRVYGEVAARRPGGKNDDDAFVALTHDSGVVSHLWMNLSAASRGPRLRVLGSDAAYVKWAPDGQEAQLQAGILPGDALYGVDPEDAWGVLGVDGDTVPVPTERGNFAAYYDELAAAIRAGGPVPVDPADSVAALRIIEAVLGQGVRDHG